MDLMTGAAFGVTALTFVGFFLKHGKDYGKLESTIDRLQKDKDEEKKVIDDKLKDLYEFRLEAATADAHLTECLNSLREQLTDIKTNLKEIMSALRIKRDG
jgi:hypothetical protein